MEDCWKRYKTTCESQRVVVRYGTKWASIKDELITRLSHSNILDDNVIIRCKWPVLDKGRLMYGKDDKKGSVGLPSYNENGIVYLVHVGL